VNPERAEPRKAARLKKFINDPVDAVEEMLEGFLGTHEAAVRRLDAARVVVARSLRDQGVRVISGAARRTEAFWPAAPGSGW
jgi:hypothetical protein